jgi:hypothetical protein
MEERTLDKNVPKSSKSTEYQPLLDGKKEAPKLEDPKEVKRFDTGDFTKGAKPGEIIYAREGAKKALRDHIIGGDSDLSK